MAQLNITLDQEEILALLSKDHDGAFRQLLQACLNKVLLAESAEQLASSPMNALKSVKTVAMGLVSVPLLCVSALSRLLSLATEIPRSKP